ncbi:MAG TPA: SpoIIE family protein phosphatase [Planctomycetaceae bacterium]|nr:SpoIIE family protein phosphatase [Planctomycetaceae bacterium]
MSDAATLHILLVDEAASGRDQAQAALADAAGVPLHVETAGDLSAAVDRVRRGGLDAVLLALNLPDSRGLATCESLHAAAPTLPIVVLSSLDDEQTAVESLERGAQDYLVRGGFEAGEVARSLRYAIGRSRAVERMRSSESRLRMLCEQLPAIVWTTDAGLTFTSSEGSGLRVLNLHPGEIVGRTLYDYFETTSDDYLPIAAARRALDGRSESFDHEWMERMFHVHVEPLRDETGTIVGTIGAALDVSDRKRMEATLHAAEEIQQSLYPRAAPLVAGFDIAGAAFPVEETAGDYFDFIPMSDGALGLVVGDVSGHGLPAALLMIALRAYLRSLADIRLHPGEILNAANRFLASDINDHRFVTLFFLRLDPPGRSLVYGGAGHCAYVLQASGKVLMLPSTGLPLGLDPEVPIDTAGPVAIEPGDVVLLLTDGFQESLSPQRKLFGLERVLSAAAADRDRPAAELIRILHAASRDFAEGEPQRDDMSAIIIKALPVPPIPAHAP